MSISCKQKFAQSFACTHPIYSNRIVSSFSFDFQQFFKHQKSFCTSTVSWYFMELLRMDWIVEHNVRWTALGCYVKYPVLKQWVSIQSISVTLFVAEVAAANRSKVKEQQGDTQERHEPPIPQAPDDNVWLFYYCSTRKCQMSMTLFIDMYLSLLFLT